MDLELAGDVLSCPGGLVARSVSPPVARLHRLAGQKQAQAAGWLDGPQDRL
jgi:hypothetical protein